MEGQRSAGKQLLTNYLRHVDTHNRVSYERGPR